MNGILYNVLMLALVAGTIFGLRLMSSPLSAVRGNRLGAVCMLAAVVLTLLDNGIVSYPILWASMAVGAIIGYVLSVRAAMIQMPQYVAFLHGLGSCASALVALVIYLERTNAGSVSNFTAGIALAIGSLTFSSSMVAAGKLAQLINQRPIRLKGHALLNASTLVVVGLLVILDAIVPGAWRPVAALFTALFALGFGVLFTIRVGGADMPITISLLNSLSGISAAVTGFVIEDPLLVAIGAVVGSAGLVLTQIMCRAMNRSLFEILTGKTMLVEPRASLGAGAAKSEDGPPARPTSPTDPAQLLRSASSVVIVPGYGMALAQAQEEVKRLLDVLDKQGKDVKFGIHPVAGRMPGHMHVLLAEVEVPYDKLYEMDAINDAFGSTDVVLVIGANDVVNPASATAEGTPIYGMPVLHVEEAKHVIVCNLDGRPGYAGVDNTLYGLENVMLLLGDAKETVRGLVNEIGGPG